MESATLTRLRSGPVWLVRLRAVRASTWAKAGFVALCAAALLGFFLFPTYPTYDSYYALIWGRDILHLHLPDFQVYRAPTEHPLAIAFGVAMSAFGHIGDRLMILGAIGSLVALVAGLYRLGRLTFGPVVGAVAVALLLTRFDYDYLAAQGYLDFSYMALVVWAGALEAARPRRGTIVFVLLGLAGLLRPEGWLLSGVYFLWCSWKADWPTRARYLALTVAPALLWAGLDTVVTGNPTYSLHSTTGLAEDLGRTKGISTLPTSTWSFLQRLDKLPLVLGAIAGVFIALILVPRRMPVPFALLVSGILAFVLLGVSGASVIDRYLLTPAVLVMLFGAVAIGGWSLLEPGSLLRRVWIVAAIALVGYGVASAYRTLSVTGIRYDLAFRNHTHLSLEKVLNDPVVRHDLATCGPLSLPNHKLAPDARWILDEGPQDVIARSEARADASVGDYTLEHRISRGVAIYPLGDAVFTQAIVDLDDNALDQVPKPGFTRLFSDQYYAVYVNCPRTAG
jgi:hypothetical protein